MGWAADRPRALGHGDGCREVLSRIVQAHTDPGIMKKGRILIVDDQVQILESLGAILSDEGHEVLKATDGQEALHIVQGDLPDAVFLDIWIPGIDGMQTLKAIKRIAPECAVVMMSGHGTIETAVKAIKMGATDYLEKPLNAEDVLHLVDKAIALRSLSRDEREGNGVAAAKLIGDSEQANELRRAIETAAMRSDSLWLTGPKGTGKEFAAKVVHFLEGKDRSALVKVRCQELSQENIDEILIGREDPARSSSRGKLAQAVGGTLLLIRIDRLEGSLRLRLADILEEFRRGQSKKQGRSAGGVRIISTSVKDPDTLAKEEAFPRKLANILADRAITIPSLGDRPSDIPLFADHFMREAAEEFDREISSVDQDALDRLMAYSWPGNVKELKVLIEHVVMTTPGPAITVNDLLIPVDRSAPPLSGTVVPRIETVDGVSAAKSAEQRQGAPSDSPFRRQTTLRGNAVMYGQGLHSGVKTGLTLSPLPPSSGILFGHITSGHTVPALLPNVESTNLSTSLRSDGSPARTIEHLMAVFHVYGLTNVLVKISGEVPIMDGSAIEFCNLVESAEIIFQDELIEEIRILEPLELPLDPKGPKMMRVEPSDVLEVEYHLDYPPPVGKMSLVYRFNGPEDFKAQIAPARTFGFVRDMQMMDEMGLAGGGRLSNVILLDDEKVVNPPLRFVDEFVRHKILDILGDFFLLGRPFRGRIIARQTGHTENIAMMRLMGERFGLSVS